MTDHKLLPKHGENVIIKYTNANLEKVKRICWLQQEAAVGLVSMLLIDDKTNDIGVPCKQCLLDTALMFYDLSEAIKDLVGEK